MQTHIVLALAAITSTVQASPAPYSWNVTVPTGLDLRGRVFTAAATKYNNVVADCGLLTGGSESGLLTGRGMQLVYWFHALTGAQVRLENSWDSDGMYSGGGTGYDMQHTTTKHEATCKATTGNSVQELYASGCCGQADATSISVPGCELVDHDDHDILFEYLIDPVRKRGVNLHKTAVAKRAGALTSQHVAVALENKAVFETIIQDAVRQDVATHGTYDAERAGLAISKVLLQQYSLVICACSPMTVLQEVGTEDVSVCAGHVVYSKDSEYGFEKGDEGVAYTNQWWNTVIDYTATVAAEFTPQTSATCSKRNTPFSIGWTIVSSDNLVEARGYTNTAGSGSSSSLYVFEEVDVDGVTYPVYTMPTTEKGVFVQRRCTYNQDSPNDCSSTGSGISANCKCSAAQEAANLQEVNKVVQAFEYVLDSADLNAYEAAIVDTYASLSTTERDARWAKPSYYDGIAINSDTFTFCPEAYQAHPLYNKIVALETVRQSLSVF
tara:strand:+ start:332 stop:1822 length:1491 start_codon:yes stop_codon:yes gene_type:complete